MNENTKKLFNFNKLSKNKNTLLKNDSLGNLKEKYNSEIELVKYNAEIERRTLADKFGLPINATWKEITKKNDILIENQSIRFK
jgi:hypothetical protein